MFELVTRISLTSHDSRRGEDVAFEYLPEIGYVVFEYLPEIGYGHPCFIHFVLKIFLCPRHKMAGAYSVTPFRHSVIPSFLHSGFSFRSLSKSYMEIFK